MLYNTMAKLAVALAGLSSTAVAFDASFSSNVALYWGQASAGSQENLAYYCESDAADIMILSFMSSFPGTDSIPTLNFASACSDTFSSGLLKCDQIAADIQTCQSLGKKVLLSMGGSAGSYGFSSDSEAEDFAGTLWDLFGEGSADERPFGDAVIDGFDFDIENNDDTGYAALATKLRSYFSEGTKDYYLSAAPQCVYPDASVGDALANAEFDFAFIQFYNNYCSVEGTFNWDTWVEYAENTSPNKDIKLYLGLPGSSSAAGSGYVDIDTIKSTVESIGSSQYFGGVMLWDASQGFTNTANGETFAAAIKDVLDDLTGETTSATTSTSSTSSTTSPSTSSTSTSTSTSKSASTSVTTSSVKATSTSSSSTITSTAVSNVKVTEVESDTTTTLTSTSTAVPSAPSAPSDTTYTTSATQTTTDATEPSVAISTTTLKGMTTSTVTEVKGASVVPKASSTSTSTVSVAGTTTSSIKASPSSSKASPSPSKATTPSPAEQKTSSTFDEVTSNTFTPTMASSTLKTVVVSSTTSTTSAAAAAAASTSTASSSSSSCDSLTGSEQATCLNTQYEAGQFAGSADTCTHGTSACTSSGEYAICNWGSWVVEGCAAGTTCYASADGDNVFIGCNWPQSKMMHKRSTEHGHHDHE